VTTLRNPEVRRRIIEDLQLLISPEFAETGQVVLDNGWIVDSSHFIDMFLDEIGLGPDDDHQTLVGDVFRNPEELAAMLDVGVVLDAMLNEHRSTPFRLPDAEQWPALRTAASESLKVLGRPDQRLPQPTAGI
jgi:hypothetical protein